MELPPRHPLLALLLAAGLRLADPRRFPKNWLLLGLAALLAGLSTQGVKEATARLRPVASLQLAVARQPLETKRLPGGRSVRVYRVGNPEWAAISPTLTVLGDPYRSRSFPSGHTAAAFAVAAGAFLDRASKFTRGLAR